ncbi:hypothetical protein THTE_4106 [Thermogutta terrifontis]|uniref:Uncharacterized protein n=1 Tax=Thermogutta terrifontis TaxID=1331910 RepID=A0A286RLB0_9BACT|nr:hypothetical protein [Thermogutta terrifontis]ASV76707.1 hypothetical protein THTE_4106 [Thermogutta terrifontis]
MSLWLPIVFCLVAMCDTHEATFLCDEPVEDLNLRRWVDRSRTWYDQLTEDERAENAVLFANAYVQLQQFRTAFNVISRVNEAAAKADGIILLCGALASHGHVDLAERLAETLSDGIEVGPKRESDSRFADSPRTRALRLIALFRMIRGDLEATLGAARKIADERARASVLLRAAEYGAKAGHYAAAEKTLRIARDLGKADPIEIARVEQVIAECRRHGRKEAPRPGFLNSLRGAVVAFAEAPAQDKEEQTQPNQSENEKPVPSLEVAWRRLEAGDTVGSRVAAEELLRFLDSRSERLEFANAVDYCLLADLFLELGDTQKAHSLAMKTFRLVMQGSQFDQGLASFTILPLMVSVLARAGCVQEAIHFIENLETSILRKEAGDLSSTGEAWLALGASCALVGRIDFIEGLVQEDRPARQKTLLSLGVAVGLLETKRQ